MVSLACDKAKEHGYPHELWTTRLLARHGREHGPTAGHECLARLVQGTVCKILGQEEIKPHKVRYYLERRDAEFEQKMAEVLCVYREVQVLKRAAAKSSKAIKRVAIVSYEPLCRQPQHQLAPQKTSVCRPAWPATTTSTVRGAHMMAGARRRRRRSAGKSSRRSCRPKPEIEIWGDGEQTRSFMYIDDCTYGTQRLMESDVRFPINLGSDELVSINQLVSTVEQIAGVSLKRNYKLDAPKGVRGRNSDNTRIKQELGWAPSTRLADGMAKTYAWIYDQMTAKGEAEPRRKLFVS